jgi:NhaP-type Na+/H+ or K+/H+ antiporter
MNPYLVLMTAIGVAVLAASVLPRLLERRSVSQPIVFVALGMVIFALPLGLEAPQPAERSVDARWAERVVEFVVIVSLMSAGLKMQRRVGLRSWATTWRLLAIAMPVTIVMMFGLGAVLVGLPVASALLLGAVLAPTDPVLASDVQLSGPSGAPSERSADEDDEVRFALTSEAGLNDGLAFSFTNLAIAVAGGGSWFVGWVTEDVALNVTVGVVAGIALGSLLGWLVFRVPDRWRLARTGEGFVAVGATMVTYGITELAHGYGFLAVFIAGMVVRQSERDHEYHQVLHDAAETLERLASVVFLLLLGGSVMDGALADLTWQGVAAAVAIVAVVRPLAGSVSLLGSQCAGAERRAIAFFGIRGMGTVYYLAHAVNDETFPDAGQVWAIAVLAILLSIVVHGFTASRVLAGVDEVRSAVPSRSGTQARGPMLRRPAA